MYECLIIGGFQALITYSNTVYFLQKYTMNVTAAKITITETIFLLTLTSHSSIFDVAMQTVKICANFGAVNEVGLSSSAANNV